MAADVRQHAHLVVLATHHDQRLVDQLGGEIVARIGHFLDPAKADPLLVEDLLPLELEKFLGCIVGRRQRPCLVWAHVSYFRQRIQNLADAVWSVSSHDHLSIRATVALHNISYTFIHLSTSRCCSSCVRRSNVCYGSLADVPSPREVGPLYGCERTIVVRRGNVNGGGNNLRRASLSGALSGALVRLSGIPERFIVGLKDYERRLGCAEKVASLEFT